MLLNISIRFLMSIILIESFTELITKSEFFRPMRALVFKFGENNKFFYWLHTLLDCGYCFSVWSSMIVVALFFRDINIIHYSVDWIFLTLVLHRLSNLFHNIMDKVHG